MNPEQLTIRLMGSPTVQWNGKDLHIQRKLPRALLYYLAGQVQPVQRDQLCLLLWPDSKDGEERRRLRETLSKLRAALPQAEVILAGREQVSLNSDQVWVDVREFQALVGENQRQVMQTPGDQPLPAAVVESLIRIVELWRPPGLLTGFDWPDSDAYEKWVVDTSHLLEDSRQMALLRLADHASATGDREKAVQWLKQAVEQNPYNHDLHGRILNYLLQIGRTGDITAYCKRLQEIYADEDGLPASLARLCEHCEQTLQSPFQSRQPWPPTSSLSVPMVGRAGEIQHLRQASGRGGAAILLGEPGVGKTRLAYEFFRQQDPAPRLILLDCQENERSLPFQPLVTSLRQSVQSHEWQELAEPWRSRLAALLPELSSLFPGLIYRSAANPKEDLHQLFEAYFQLMNLLAKNQRLMMIVDDLQWCDESTRSALSYLLEQGFFHPPNFLLITARSESLSLELEEFLEQPQWRWPFQKINLPLLKAGDILEICRGILGEALPEEIIQRIKQDTGGNPLYVIEWSRSRLIYLSQHPDGQDFNPPSGGLVELMRHRLNFLTSSSRQVLAAAAVIGRHFQPDQIARIADLSSHQTSEAFLELERTNLIQPMDGTSTYLFIHDKIREIVWMDLSLARRRMLHLRAAHLLQAGWGGDENPNVAQVATHYEAAGEVNAAVMAWLAAARHALWLFSHKEAEGAFQRAENLVRIHGSRLPDETILCLYSTWGFFSNQATNLKEAQRIFTTLLSIGEQRRNRILMGVAYTGLAQYHHQVAEMDRALNAANQAVLLLENLPDLFERANALYTRGSIFIIFSQFRNARQDLETVLSITADATDANTSEIRALSESLLAIIYNLQGLPIQAEQLASQARGAAKKIQSPFAESNALVSLVMSNFYQFKYNETIQLVEEGIQFSQAHQFWHNLGYLHFFRALVFLSRGYLDQCWTTLQTLHMIAVNHRCEDLLASEWLVRGQMHRFLWNFPAALECFQQGQSVAYGGQDRLELLTQQAIVLGMAGQFEESAQLFETVLQQSKVAGVGLVYYPALTARLGALALGLPAQQLLADADFARQEIQACEIYDVHEFINYGLAITHLRAGNFDQALSLAARFNQYAQSAESPWLKVIDYTLQKIFAGATGQTVSEAARLNMQATLEFLDHHIQHPDLHQNFESFRELLLTQIL